MLWSIQSNKQKKKTIWTYLFHFYEEGVDVVPGVGAVQALFVSLHFFAHELVDDGEVFEQFIVRSRQVIHQPREGLVQLLNRKHTCPH